MKRKIFETQQEYEKRIVENTAKKSAKKTIRKFRKALRSK